MCTRYFIDNTDPVLVPIIQEMYNAPLYKTFVNKQPSPVITSGEVAPTNVVPVIAPDRNGKRKVYPMKWGYWLQKNEKPLVNARSETAAEKPTFREDWNRHRCIIPSSYYFEWKHLKDEDNLPGAKVKPEKYMFQTEGSSVTWLCGLYRIEDGLPYFVILTKDAEGEIREIHDRMPLILPEERITDWIDPGKKPEQVLPYIVNAVAMAKAE